MKIKHIISVALLFAAALTGVDSSAQEKYWIESLLDANLSVPDVQPVVEEAHPDLLDYTVEENLAIPVLNEKQQAKARKSQATEVNRLKKIKDIEVETLRNKEVIHITILASKLFVPNETTLTKESHKYLRELLPFLRLKDYYHMLIVVHSDNTGDEEYNFALTSDRSIAIIDWFEENGGYVDYIAPYAAGSVEPREKNNTIEGRNLNRRVEFYIIPAEAMFK